MQGRGCRAQVAGTAVAVEDELARLEIDAQVGVERHLSTRDDVAWVRHPRARAIDNLEASIDEGGNWKTFERALELVCSQRVQNVWKADTSKHSATKRKPTCSLSLCLPDSGPLQNQTTGTRQSARLLSLVFQPSGPPPPLV